MTPDIAEDERKLIREWLIDDNERLEPVLKVLSETAPALRRRVLVSAVADKTGVDQKTSDSLLRMFFSLVSTIFSSQDREDAISSIFHVVLGEPAEAEKLSAFKLKVERLLALRSVEITSKALRVMFDNPNTFCRARTLSELRPIFTDDGLKAQAAVIVHQLKLVYHSGPDHKENEIFITLDREDLDAMRRVIDRAIAKDAEFSSMVKDLTILQPMPAQ